LAVPANNQLTGNCLSGIVAARCQHMANPQNFYVNVHNAASNNGAVVHLQ
jgi:hypothetical protein